MRSLTLLSEKLAGSPPVVLLHNMLIDRSLDSDADAVNLLFESDSVRMLHYSFRHLKAGRNVQLAGLVVEPKSRDTQLNSLEFSFLVDIVELY